MKKLSGLRPLKRKWLSSQQGYALFQLGIVLALLVIICTLSVPRLSFLQYQLVKAEAEKIVLMFRYLQRTALVHNKDQYLQLFCSEGYYEGGGHRENLPEGVIFSVIPGAYGPPSNPIQELEHPSTYIDDRVTFYAQGTMQAGVIYLSDKNHHVMYAVSTAVSPIAFIRAYRYNSARQEWLAL